MLAGAGRTITWDAENRPVSITAGNVTATFVYDGDGNRALKTEGGQTTLYINKYYEKSLTSGNATGYYFLGGRLIGMKEGAANVNYVHQDHLTGTSVVSDSAGALVSSIAYAPFGATRAGAVSTDIQFTGQRLDSTGLYFYNARYYDPQIGRFISADSIVPDFSNPQALNRYAYVVNNPLKYTDPSGHIVQFENEEFILGMYDEMAYWGTYYDLSEFYGGMIDEWENALDEWGSLREQEPEYTQHMIDSDIIFNIVGVDASLKKVTYNADMRGYVDFKEPVQLQLVSKDSNPMYSIMQNVLGGASGVSLYPGPIYIRTDIPLSAKGFSWLIAHESFHRWEQSYYGSPNFNWISDWYFLYVTVEARMEHALRPREKRANNYANYYYSIN